MLKGTCEKEGIPLKRRSWLIACLVTLALCAGGLYFLVSTGFFQAATSVEGLQDYIQRFTPYSHLCFFVLQLLSVIIAPIPSNISAAAGGVLFGTWPSFFMTVGAVFLGSAAVFLLARILGRSFADRFVSSRVSQKYLDLIQSKQDVFLTLAFLFPFFPDDLICILAGLTSISIPRFLVIMVLTRPWGLLVASAVGGAALDIPLGGMVVLGLGGLLIFLFGMKYGDRVENWIIKKLRER